MSKTIQIFICLLSVFFFKSVLAQGIASNALQPEIVTVTVKASQYSASDIGISVLVYKLPQVINSQSKEASPVVIFSHGRTGTIAGRAALKNPVNPNIVRYWHSHGYSVAVSYTHLTLPTICSV